MKKIGTLLGLSILFFIMDNTFAPFFNIKGYFPSILFVFIICFSIVSDTWSSVLLGIFAGFLQDLYLCNALGINMLINMLMCLLANKIGENVFKDKILVPVLSNFAISLLKGIMVFVILYILKQKMYIEYALYTSIYNIVIAIIMYKKIYKLCQKDFMIKNWKF